MELADNPLLQPEDFMAPYRQSIKDMQNNPDLVAFDKLCYETFVMSEIGKKFMEHVTDKYLLPSLVNRDAPNYQTMVVWAEGFKDFPRMIRHALISHEQRIKAGQNQ